MFGAGGERRARPVDGAGRSAGVSCPIPKGEVIRAWVFFFLNIFAYIYHFIVCIYRRPHRKSIFVIVDLLILFT